MATLKEGLELTGSLGSLSAYKIKGSDKIIVRRKGGPKRKQVLNSKKFERTRENMKEFLGVGMAVKAIRSPLIPVKRLAEHNFTSTLTRICKKIQVLDKAGERGQRGIYLSQHRYMLAGFRLNKKHPFMSIVTGPVNVTLSRELKSAIIQLPQLIADVTLNIPWKRPLFRFCMSLGVVPDVIYEGNDYNNYPAEWAVAKLDTAWYVVTEPFQSQTVELKLDKPGPIKDSHTLVFSIGIEMGTPTPYGEIEEVKYAGSACILAVG
ncbi:MAG TPA: hypothetical protein VGD35_24805 [Chitinophaga sp.]